MGRGGNGTFQGKKNNQKEWSNTGDSNIKHLLEIIHREQSAKLQPVLQECIAPGVSLVPTHLSWHFFILPHSWQLTIVPLVFHDLSIELKEYFKNKNADITLLNIDWSGQWCSFIFF